MRQLSDQRVRFAQWVKRRRFEVWDVQADEPARTGGPPCADMNDQGRPLPQDGGGRRPALEGKRDEAAAPGAEG